MTLIGIAGYAQSGKSETGRILVEHHGFKAVAFADPIREMMEKLNPIVVELFGTRYIDALELYGYEDAKRFPEVRRLLQVLGTEAGRGVLGESIWLDTFQKRYDPAVPTVVTDVRFPNEAELIREMGGEVWRVHRDGTGALNAHPSETGVDDVRADFYVRNDRTLEHLQELVGRILARAAA